MLSHIIIIVNKKHHTILEHGFLDRLQTVIHFNYIFDLLLVLLLVFPFDCINFLSCLVSRVRELLRRGDVDIYEFKHIEITI